MSGTGRPKGTVLTWTADRVNLLRELSATHSRADAALIMGMTENQLKGQAQRMDLRFTGQRKRRVIEPRQRPVVTRNLAKEEAESRHTRLMLSIGSSMQGIDPRRADARLRKFSWEAEA